MGRDDCVEMVKSEGFTVGKSSCFYCPSMRQGEIRKLQAQYPDLAERALAMEANSEAHTVVGLGRSYRWADLLATDDLFGDESFIEQACGCYDG